MSDNEKLRLPEILYRTVGAIVVIPLMLALAGGMLWFAWKLIQS